MYVVIVGGGKVGSYLAKMLSEQGSEVTLVEVSKERCALLQPEMKELGVKLICGDGDEPFVLEEADVRSASALVAATGHDEDNLVVTLLGKNEYKVPFTVARINNPRNEWLYTDEFGVDMPVSNTSMMADMLKRCAVEAGREAGG
jgi:trk system potassium uptake protein TrkA